MKLGTGIGKRLGVPKTSEDLGEFITENILLPFRYGIIATQYGYNIEFNDRIRLQPYIGGGILFANDLSYFVLPTNLILSYDFNNRIAIGLNGQYNFNSLNNYYSINLMLRFQIKKTTFKS